jgi:uncharacterized protein YgiM (DUF1202 family)
MKTLKDLPRCAIRCALALALCLGLLLGNCGALAESYSARQIAHCDEYVNLREDPDTKSRSLGRVYIGEVVMARRYNSKFSYCCYNGEYGYILSEYLTSKIQPWSDGTFHVTNCNEYISLRKMTERGAEVRAKIPLGATLDEIYYNDGGDTSGNYVYVKYNGKYGFVLWDYLSSSRGGGKTKSMAARQVAYCNEYVNLRESADSKSRSLCKVYIGEVVMAAPYDSNYSYCCYNGEYGYILSEYLTSRITPYSEGTFYVTNCKEYISLRKMPVKGSDVLAKIPLGATLDAIYYHDGGYTNDSFVYVKYKGKYGFVLWDYLAARWYPGGQ